MEAWHPAARSLLSEPAYRELKRFVIESTGLSFYENKDEDLAERIERRMSAQGLTSCASYLGRLRDAPDAEAEFDRLVTELTIGKTEFFRHREQFDAIRETVIPDLLERRARRRNLRLWSAGCATGEEPFSLAILLRRELGVQLAGWDVSVLGTDINREFLARAREASYEARDLESVPDAIRLSGFRREGESWVVAPDCRELVSFQYHNLVRHPFPSLANGLFAFDLILCRNVLIYFDREIAFRLVARFRDTLAEGGWLVLGHAEITTLELEGVRIVQQGGITLCQRQSQKTVTDSSVPEPEGLRGIEKRLSRAARAITHLLPEASAKDPPRRRVDDERPCAPEPVTTPAPRPALSKEPADIETLRRLADQGAWEEASRICRELEEMERLNPRFYFYQALVNEHEGDHQRVEESLRRAIYLDRRFALAHYHLGLTLQRRGKAKAATRAFANVIELLAKKPSEELIADADGLTAADLAGLAEMQCEVLEGA